MERNIVKIDKDCFTHLKELIKMAEDHNARAIRLYEFIEGNSDHVSCSIVMDDTNQNIIVPIAVYDRDDDE